MFDSNRIPPPEDTFTREQLEGVLRAFEERDPETVASFWAEDGRITRWQSYLPFPTPADG